MIRVEGALQKWRETPGMPGLDGLGRLHGRKPLRLQEKVWSYMYSTRRTATASFTNFWSQTLGEIQLLINHSEFMKKDLLISLMQNDANQCGLHGFIMLYRRTIRHIFSDLRCSCCSRGSPTTVPSDVAEAPHGAFGSSSGVGSWKMVMMGLVP